MSNDEAIKIIKSECYIANLLNLDRTQMVNTALDLAIKALEQTRLKGKWIQTKDDCDGVNFYDFSFKCSKCGKEQSFKSNYCPNCGADMRGDSE